MTVQNDKIDCGRIMEVRRHFIHPMHVPDSEHFLNDFLGYLTSYKFHKVEKSIIHIIDIGN